MGIFDLFKTKQLKFEKKCSLDGPNYLKGNFQNISDHLMNRFRIVENDFTWTRQLVSSKGGTKFKVEFFGGKKGNLIVPNGELPQVLKLIDITTNKKISLFDGAKHGYNAVFWQEFPNDINERQLTKTLEINGESEFEIVILLRYSLDLKEQFEEDFNRDGYVENNRKEKLGHEAYLNGFDSIQVFAFGENGKRIEILSEETA